MQALESIVLVDVVFGDSWTGPSWASKQYCDMVRHSKCSASGYCLDVFGICTATRAPISCRFGLGCHLLASTSVSITYPADGTLLGILILCITERGFNELCCASSLLFGVTSNHPYAQHIQLVPAQFFLGLYVSWLPVLHFVSSQAPDASGLIPRRCSSRHPEYAALDKMNNLLIGHVQSL